MDTGIRPIEHAYVIGNEPTIRCKMNAWSRCLSDQYGPDNVLYESDYDEYKRTHIDRSDSRYRQRTIDFMRDVTRLYIVIDALGHVPDDAYKMLRSFDGHDVILVSPDGVEQCNTALWWHRHGRYEQLKQFVWVNRYEWAVTTYRDGNGDMVRRWITRAANV